MNFEVAVFPLLSVAAQVTRVLPSLKRLPERGLHRTSTEPSTASCAVTVNLTRTLFARRGARTVLLTAPLRVGGVTSTGSGSAPGGRAPSRVPRVLADGSEGVPEIEVRDVAAEDNAGDA
jgi:hypothetical protein